MVAKKAKLWYTEKKTRPPRKFTETEALMNFVPTFFASPEEELYDIERLKSELSAEGIAFCVYETLDSTNAEAKRRAADVPTPALFIAEEQTEGRGRLGRSFFSPRGKGVYLSLLLETESPADTVGLTSAAAVATVRAIRAVTGKETGIKWVNDIVWQGKKVAGILAEGFSSEGRSFAVVGVGVNLCEEDGEFPEALRQTAISLGEDKHLLTDLAATLAKELNTLLRTPLDRSVTDEYRALSLVLGKRVTYTENGETHTGKAVAVNDDGTLSVRLSDGSLSTLASGEISLSL